MTRERGAKERPFFVSGPLLVRLFRSHACHCFIKERKHRGVAFSVVDCDKRGGAANRPHGSDGKFVCPAHVPSGFVCSGDQGTEGAAPPRFAVRGKHRHAIHVSSKAAPAPVIFIFDKSPSPCNDLKMERLGHRNYTGGFDEAQATLNKSACR